MNFSKSFNSNIIDLNFYMFNNINNQLRRPFSGNLADGQGTTPPGPNSGFKMKRSKAEWTISLLFF